MEQLITMLVFFHLHTMDKATITVFLLIAMSYGVELEMEVSKNTMNGDIVNALAVRYSNMY